MPYTKKETLENKDFLAMIVHDIKTPVKAQIRAMNLLLSGAYGSFNEEVENIFTNIIASNKYMQYLVDNILNEYKINKEGLILNKTRNDIRKTIEESLLNVGILFEAKKQKIEISYLSDIYILEYDEIEIQRVIINLLSNTFEHAKENSLIKLSVNKENLDLKIKIENKTSCKNMEVNPLTAGTGLGLLICEKIIKEHKGKFFHNIKEDNYIAEVYLPL